MNEHPTSDSRRYAQRAKDVTRLADQAASAAEKQDYLDIAEGWRRLSTEAARHEKRDAQHQAPRETRSFQPRERR